MWMWVSIPYKHECTTHFPRPPQTVSSVRFNENVKIPGFILGAWAGFTSGLPIIDLKTHKNFQGVGRTRYLRWRRKIVLRPFYAPNILGLTKAER